MRITVSCPQALIPQGNQLAMCLAFSEADSKTYGLPNWQDTDGNLYAAASFLARQEWITAAQSSLVRPAWDTEEIIDITAAAEAQAAMQFWLPDAPGFPPAASTSHLIAVGGMEGIAALAAMGLTPTPDDEDLI